MSKIKPKFVDLFCGAGGLSLGLTLSGMECIGAIDSDPASCLTHQNNLSQGDSQVICSDIKKINPKNLKELTRNETIDILVGGPPCQGFSHIGRSKLATLTSQVPRFLNDPRNKLYKQFVRIAKYLSPQIILMENVRGIHTHKNGSTSAMVKASFNNIGYNCEGVLLNSVKYGIPQKRERMIFVGVKKELCHQKGISPADFYPLQTHLSPKKIINTNGDKEEFVGDPEQCLFPVTVAEAFSRLPHLNNGEGSELMEYPAISRSQFSSKHQCSYINDWVLKPQLYRNHKQEIYNHVSRNHRDLDIEIFKIMKPGMIYRELPKRYQIYGNSKFLDKFKRLIPSKPSWTVVAHLSKDGYMYIHPTDHRTITVREAARLQSFPDWFRFYGPKTSQFRQVGNAVPPRMAYTIGKHVLNVVENFE